MKRAEKFTPNRLRKYRLLMGYDQKDVAILLGFKSRGRISEWEQGTSMPSLDNLIQLSIILRTPIDELYYDLRLEFVKDIKERIRILQEQRDKGG